MDTFAPNPAPLDAVRITRQRHHQARSLAVGMESVSKIWHAAVTHNSVVTQAQIRRAECDTGRRSPLLRARRTTDGLAGSTSGGALGVGADPVSVRHPG